MLTRETQRETLNANGTRIYTRDVSHVLHVSREAEKICCRGNGTTVRLRAYIHMRCRQAHVKIGPCVLYGIHIKTCCHDAGSYRSGAGGSLYVQLARCVPHWAATKIADANWTNACRALERALKHTRDNTHNDIPNIISTCGASTRTQRTHSLPDIPTEGNGMQFSSTHFSR